MYQRQCKSDCGSVRGFSLIEMSILLAVIGMLTVTLLTSGLIGREKYRLTETEEKLEKIQAAIQVYYNRNGYLPCPAVRTEASSTATLGLESNCSAAAVAGVTDVLPTGGVNGNDDIRIGAVPTRTLLLPDTYLYDEWGNRFSYVVIKKLAISQGDFQSYSTALTNGVIKILDETGAPNSISMADVNGYLLLSHGADRKGAYSKQGTVAKACNATTDIDYLNCDDTDAVFVNIPIDEDQNPADANATFTGTTTPYFYDLVRSMKTGELVEAAESESSSTSSTSGSDPTPPTPSPTGNGDGSGSGSGTSGGGPGGSPNPVVAAKSCNLAITMEVGVDETCLVNGDGRAYCWGVNTFGQLGIGSTTDTTTPTELTGGYSDWVQIRADGKHTCGLRSNATDNSLYCWGSNDYGELGNGATGTGATSPTLVSGGFKDWVKIDVDSTHSCALRSNGRLYCWGENATGKLGIGNNVDRNVPVEVSGSYSNWENFTTGSRHSCGIRAGRIYCWGGNGYGQLGIGTTTDSNTPVEVNGGFSDWAQVVSDHQSTYALRAGRAYSWGNGLKGALGNGGTTDVLAPAEISGSYTDWTYLTPGVEAGCGIRNGGRAYCWGRNDSGQLGDGTMTNRLVPTEITGGYNDYNSIAITRTHGCASRESKTTYQCWGSNAYGQLGNGTTTDSLTAVEVNGFEKGTCNFGANCSTTFVEAAGGDQVGYTLMPDGHAYIWGSNTDGVFGDGTTTASTTPRKMGKYEDWYAINVNAHNNGSCGIRNNGRLYCWGKRNYGRVGDGGATTGNQLVPAEVQGGYNDWVEVDVDAEHACARRGYGRTYCWGRNINGKLGITGGTDPNMPTEVQGNYTDWSDINVGLDHSCGIRNSSDAYCWGLNSSGQLGDGTTTSRSVPTLVTSSTTDWKWISMMYNTTCAVTKAGRAYCWGQNNYSQVGDGTTTNRLTPVELPGAYTNWSYISGGVNSSCGHRSGSLYCWGTRDYGTIGDGGATTGTQTTPIAVPGISDWVFVGPSNENSCASTQSGKVYCWGRNQVGQVGDGTTSQRIIPTYVPDAKNSCVDGSACVIQQAIMGTDRLTCAINAYGKAYCWGHNDYGQTGSGTVSTSEPLPVEVTGAYTDWYILDNDDSMACGIRKIALDSGKLYCWGRNNIGQLGNGGTTNSSSPVEVSGGFTNWSVTDVENRAACALRSTGHAYCWGLGTDGQIGDGGTTNRAVPTLVTGGFTDWIDIDMADVSACGVRGTTAAGGTGWCWGTNDYGQLGIGTTGNSPTPVAVSGGFTDWKAINSAGKVFCGLRATGQAYCWGRREQGSIGDGVTGSGMVTTPTEVAGGYTDWSLIESGNAHACGIRSGGKLYCWGKNDMGQVGIGTTGAQYVPILVSGGHNDWISATMGNGITCGVRTNQKMYCWGENTYGQLGNGTLINSSLPIEVTSFTGMTSSCADESVCRIDIKAAYNVGLAINYDGKHYAWGDNSGGVFGDGTTLSSSSPVPGATLYTDWVKVSSDYSGYIGCGIRENGRLYCWGQRSANGYLGDGITTTGVQLTPVEISGGYDDWVDFEVGGGTTCALRSAGRMYCWGENITGQVGDGSTTSRPVPTEVSGGATDWISIGDVESRSCGIRGIGASGTAYCWGRNSAGQLGRGSTGGTFPTPQLVLGGFTDWMHVGGKGEATCGLRASGAAYCWGDNVNGQIGDGTTTNRNTPTPVSGSYTDWKQIVAGDHTTCGLRGKTAYCWGYNGQGQVGNGTTATPVTTPTLVFGGFADWAHIDATGNAGNTCAARENGKYYCWGANASGQLGDGTTTNRTIPTEVVGVNGCSITDSPICANSVQYFVRPGEERSHGVDSNGRGWSWGRNITGGLGDGTTTNSLVPVEISGGITDWIAIDSDGGTTGSCGLRLNGTILCWGPRTGYLVADGGAVTGNQLIPVEISGGFTDWKLLTVDDVACGLRKTGQAYCWGQGSNGAQGNGTTNDNNVPIEVSGSYNDWTHLVSGGQSVCGIRNGGVAYCWGRNVNGQLGVGHTTGTTYPTPQPVVGGFLDWKTIAGTSSTKCALRITGQAYCWGSNTSGKIGDGTTTARGSPTEIPGAYTNWTSMSSADTNSCGIRGGVLYCWGEGVYGAVGDGTTTNRLTPTLVSGGFTDWKHVTGGRKINCALRAGVENYYCWGLNDYGQIGDGTTTNRLVPTPVVDLTAPSSDSCEGTNCTPPAYYRSASFQANFGCAITANGKAYCWGGENSGQLGNGSPDANSLIPAEVSGGYADWKMIDTSEMAACGVRQGGMAYCWGRNTTGKAGTGTTTTPLHVPTQVATYTDWSYVTSGRTAACGLRNNNHGYCWGENTNGELGDGTNIQSLTPQEIAGAYSNWESVVAGDNSSCGIRGGTAYCWGRNSNGQLGRGTTGGTFNTPQLVSGGYTDWTLIINGNQLTCGLRSGRAYCWGDNTTGSIGDGSTTSSNVPIEVSGSYNDWKTIAANFANTCGIRSGRAYCWGIRDYGRVGDGGAITGNQLTPSLVTGGYTDFIFIDTTLEHSCGVRQTGEFYCWGDNPYGEFGTGNTISSTTPVSAASGLSLKIPLECGGKGSGCVDQAGWIEAGNRYGCAVDGQHKGWCWGSNTDGRLGNGTTTDTTIPVEISGNYTDWKTIRADYLFACGLRSANGLGRIYCWGNNATGQLGNGTTTNSTVPALISGGFTDWSALDTDQSHACALRKTGRLYCWGDNTNGQLGNNSTINSTIPAEVSGNHTTWTSLAIASTHSCAIRSGQAYCWGDGSNGRTGLGSTATTLVPTQVSGAYTDWTQITTNHNATCGLRASKRAFCWGSNTNGQLGDSTTTQRLVPTEIWGSFTDWTYLNAGTSTTCGIRNGMHLYCWGDNTNGALGDGTTISSPVPVAVQGDHNDYTAVSTRSDNTCALREASSKYYCWGKNNFGQLGNATTTDTLTPTAVVGLSGASCETDTNDICLHDAYFIRPGRERSHGVDKSGRGYSWGDNTNGGLGDGTTVSSLTPVEVFGGYTDWISIDTDGTAARASCGLRSNGTIWCWGPRTYGSIGDGGATAGNQLIPVQIAGGFTDWNAVSTDLHSCALRSNGRAYCWGEGAVGELGNGSTANRTSPTEVSGSYTDWTEIQSGGYHSCGIRNGGELYCWGDNTHGTIGNGVTGGTYSTPQLVAGGYTDWAHVHGNSTSRCGVRASGRAYCWGENLYGKLGDNTNTSRSTPTEVYGAYTDWQDIATANSNSCGIRNNGHLYCWGRGLYGANGNGTTTSSWIPVEATGGYDDWTYVAAGGEIACGLRSTSNSYWCWGRNNLGQIGDGTTTNQPSPIAVLTLGAPQCSADADKVCSDDLKYFIRPGKERSHTIDAYGQGWSWGKNNTAGLGDGTTTDSLTPVKIAGGFTDWVAIDSDGYDQASCGLRSNGTIWCWGSRSSGAIGDGGATSGTQPNPVPISGGYTDWKKLSVDLAACAIRGSGIAYCWGGGVLGRLGNGSTANVNVPTLVSGGFTDWSEIQTGFSTSCGIRGSGIAYCWGDNSTGSTGIGITGGNYNTPQAVAGGFTDWTLIQGNSATKCGLRRTGQAYCWGTGTGGQIGDGAATSRDTPTQVSGAYTDWTIINASEQNTCGIRNGGALYCWGYGNYGALGNGGSANSNIPTLVSGGYTDWTYVATGRDAACGIRAGNSRYLCWGRNDVGQLGDGTTVNKNTPTQVLSITVPSDSTCTNCNTDFYTGKFYGMGINKNNRAFGWGDNSYGGLGNGTTTDAPTAVEVSGANTDWVMLDGEGSDPSCGLRANGKIYCWGARFLGSIGDGGALTGADQLTPVEVAGGFSDWSFVTTDGHSCGMRNNGRAYCWGENTNGRLGDGTTTNRGSPTQISGSYTDWQTLAVGGSHSCGIRNAGTLYCWGLNANGSLGNGTLVDSSTPALVSGGYTDWTKVNFRALTTCGLRSTGQAYCWGENANGQIGDGTAVQKDIPTEVTGLYTDWTKLESGDDVTCGLRTNGRIYCWGNNANGGLGNGAMPTNSLVPVAVAGGYTDWKYVAVGSSGACGVRSSQTSLYCWGLNADSQLGDGTTTNRDTPTPMPNFLPCRK